ncbi:reverse transcriptase domain, Reverse transcriptase zinc-binding domain protein [Artemisia annua]|uniref:Reverse transcriptase domain, Reverse transcriptase zinc-binding domain protein n=1 Tax=Artemisia annua TaxID=35608 RepID=A0A2U1M735_ARTAN|nr:reverse transcriptase domain, Reverse transcriptase zinc-binding domain protein [Artemisia annua]
MPLMDTAIQGIAVYIKQLPLEEKTQLTRLENLLRILRCFRLASGIKVNLSKSALYGVGVDRNEVDWMAIISSIHGSFGGFNSNTESIKGSGLWIKILKAGWKINDSGVPFISSFKRKVVSALDKDCSIQQWVSASLENRDLWRRDLFLGREMQDLENFDSVVMGLSLHDGVDGFSVSILRSRIDSLELSQSDPATLWNVLIPKKVNIFFWRLTRNRLPPKQIWLTKMVKPIWDSISRWCNVHVSLARSQDFLELSCSVGLASVFTKTFDGILRITSWVIWKHRNEKIFKNKDMSTNVVVIEIKALSHLWIHSRSRGEYRKLE